jgi:hypothetical protein
MRRARGCAQGKLHARCWTLVVIAVTCSLSITQRYITHKTRLLSLFAYWSTFEHYKQGNVLMSGCENTSREED